MYLIAPAHREVPQQHSRNRARAKRGVALIALFAAVAFASLALTTRHADAAAASASSAPTAPAPKGAQGTPAPAPKPNADYPVTLHVVNSFLELATAISTIEVTIDSDPTNYQYCAVTRGGILAPGDYPARDYSKSGSSPGWMKHTYRILFPDGKTGDFTLCGQWSDQK
jgi:hypothetical protein